MWPYILLVAYATFASSATVELRRPRQLDLGPATNEISKTDDSRSSNFQQPGYLPPIEPAGAQDDPVVLVPTTPPSGPRHHGRDLCTDPFHSFLCANLKPRRRFTGALPNQRNLIPDASGLSGANTFLEPSKVLAPPLNDLEDPTTTTTRRPFPSTTYRPFTTQRLTTTYRPPPTTTRRPTTTSTTTRRPTTTTTTRRPTTTTTTTRRPTTTTTTTTERPIAPEPSNDVRTYLPPEPIAPAAASQDLTVVKPDPEEHHHHHPHHHGRDLCSDPFHSFLCAPLKPRKRITGDLPNGLQGQNSFLAPQKIRPEPEISPQPSNEIDRAYLPPSTTRRPTTTTTRRPTTTTTYRTIEPQPSNEIDRAYLQPSTTRRPPPPPPPPTTTRRPPPPPPPPRPTTPRPPPPVQREYLPPSTTTRRTTTTTEAPIEVQPSNEIDRSYLPPVAPQPSNVDNVIIPPEQKIEPAAAQDDPALAPPDHDHHHHHHHGSHGFRDICSDPFHSFLCTVPKPRTRITGALPERFRNNGLNPAPSNVDETRVRVLERKTEKFKIVVVPQDSQAPAPSQQQDTKIPPPGYSFPHPENKLSLPSETKPVVGYDYPKPSQPFPQPTNGYSYPKPEQKLTLPSEIRQEIVRPTTPPPRPSSTGYSYPKPVKKLTLPSEVRPEIVRTTTLRPIPTSTGYSYPKPEKKLTLPSEEQIQIVNIPRTPRPTTTTTKGYSYPKPEKQFTLPPQTTGYNYPKPDVKLTLPSENKPVIGYDYPKPSVGLPEPTKGYDYPKPSIGLPEPTKDYDNSRPNLKFQLPSERYDNRLPVNRLPLPLQNQQQNFGGYSQPIQSQKPATTIPPPLSSNKNSLPSSIQEARQRLQGSKLTQISNISDQNSVSDLITVNKVDFPEAGKLGVKFGERLKRRERKSHLLTPFGSHRL